MRRGRRRQKSDSYRIPFYQNDPRQVALVKNLIKQWQEQGKDNDYIKERLKDGLNFNEEAIKQILEAYVFSSTDDASNYYLSSDDKMDNKNLVVSQQKTQNQPSTPNEENIKQTLKWMQKITDNRTATAPATTLTPTATPTTTVTQSPRSKRKNDRVLTSPMSKRTASVVKPGISVEPNNCERNLEEKQRFITGLQKQLQEKDTKINAFIKKGSMQNTNLQAQLEEKTKDNIVKDQFVKTIQAQLNANNLINQQLETKIADCEKEKTDKQTFIDRLKTQQKQITEKLTATENHLIKCNNGFKTRKAWLQNKDKEIRTLKTKSAQLEKTKLAIEETNKQLQQQLSAVQKQLQKLGQFIKQEKSKHTNELSVVQKAATTAKTGYNQQLAQSTKKITALTTKQQSLIAELENLRRMHEILKEKSKNTTNMEKLQKCHQQNQDLQHKFGHIKEEYANMKVALQNAQETHRKLEDQARDRDVLQTNVAKLKTNIQQLTTQHVKNMETLENKHSAMLRTLRKELATKDRHISNLAFDIDRLNNDLKRVNLHKETLSNKLDKVKKQLAEETEETQKIARLLQEKKELRDKLTSITEQHAALQREANRTSVLLEEQQQSYQKQYESWSNREEVLQKELKQKNSQIQQLDAKQLLQATTFRNTRQIVMKNYNDMKERENEMNKSIKDLSVKLITLGQKHSDLKAASLTGKTDLNTLQAKNTELQAKHKTTKKQLEELLEEKDFLQKEQQNCQTQLTELKRKEQAAQDLKTTLDTQYKTKVQSEEALQKELAKKNAEIQELQNKQATQTTKYTKARQQLMKEYKAIKEREKQLNESMNDLMNNLETFQKQHNELQEASRKDKTNFAKLQEQNNELKTKHQDVKDELAKLLEEKETLQQEKQSCREKFKELQNNNQTVCTEVRYKLVPMPVPYFKPQTCRKQKKRTKKKAKRA